jgi:hypothetical protein
MKAYSNLFLKKNKFYYNYTIDLKFKFKIYEKYLILLEKKNFFIFNIYKKIYISKNKRISERWKDINRIILKKSGNVNFLFFYSIASH